MRSWWKPPLLCILVLAVLLCRSGGRADPSLDLGKAGLLASEGQYSSALDYCRPGLTGASPPLERGRALFIAGFCQFKLGDHGSARRSLKKASRLHPGLWYHTIYYGANSFQEQERYKEAARLWEKLIQNQPPGDLAGRALMNLVRCKRRGRDPKGALAAVETISLIEHQDPSWSRELQYTKAWAKHELEAYASARKLLLEMWRDNPESFWADQAAELLQGEEAQDLLLPGEDSAITQGDRIQRVENLIKKNLPERALEELEPVIKEVEKSSSKDRLADLLKLRGRAYMKKRLFKKAIADFERSISLGARGELETRYFIANCLRRSGYHSRAINAYRHIWTKHPNSSFSTRSLFYAARLMKINKDWKKAQATYRKLAGDYKHSSLRPEALFQIAWIHILKKNLSKAALYLERVPELGGDWEFNSRTLYWKSVVMRGLGKKEKAEEFERKLLKDYWKSAYAFYLVTLNGCHWPHQPGGKVIPKMQKNQPLELRIAGELLYLGLKDDARGQLRALESSGDRIPEWLTWAVAKKYVDLEDYFHAQSISNRQLSHRLQTPPPGERRAWQMAFPRAFPGPVTSYAKEYKLDPLLLWSLMRAESTYRPGVTSQAGAMGLMQIMPATGRQIAGWLGQDGFSTTRLREPEHNVRYGALYLSRMIERFRHRGEGPESTLWTISKAAAAYNAGPYRVEDWAERALELKLSPEAFIEEIPITETRNYVKRILKFYLVYLYSNPRPPEEPGQASLNQKAQAP